MKWPHRRPVPLQFLSLKLLSQNNAKLPSTGKPHYKGSGTQNHRSCGPDPMLHFFEGFRHSLLPHSWDLQSFCSMSVIGCLMEQSSIPVSRAFCTAILHPSPTRKIIYFCPHSLEFWLILWCGLTNPFPPSNAALKSSDNEADLASWKMRGQMEGEWDIPANSSTHCLSCLVVHHFDLWA